MQFHFKIKHFESFPPVYSLNWKITLQKFLSFRDSKYIFVYLLFTLDFLASIIQQNDSSQHYNYLLDKESGISFKAFFKIQFLEINMKRMKLYFC